MIKWKALADWAFATLTFCIHGFPQFLLADLEVDHDVFFPTPAQFIIYIPIIINLETCQLTADKKPEKYWGSK
jgi:hypothetical protein